MLREKTLTLARFHAIPWNRDFGIVSNIAILEQFESEAKLLKTQSYFSYPHFLAPELTRR